MLLQRSEKIASTIIKHLEENVWQTLARKAVQKMAPFKLTNESTKMFSDFTVLNSGISKQSGTTIVEEPDDVCKISQNYILGTSKIVQRTLRSKSQRHSEQMPKAPLASRVAIRKLKTVANQEDTVLKEPKKNNFFKLNQQENRNIDQEKLEQSIRINRQSELKYAQNLENAYRYSLAQRQQKMTIQKKRFKEMKTYTYDFEGRLLSTGQQKRDGNLNVLKVNSQLSQEMITALKKNKKFSEAKVKQIVNKKVVQNEKVFISDFMKEQKQKQLQKQAKQKQQKKSVFEKGIAPINIMEIFKKQDSISAGVHITEINSKSKISGRTRDKDNVKNLNLLEYKDKSIPIELFPQKRLRQAAKTTSYFRTEGNEPLFQRDRERTKTQSNDYSRKNFTSSSKYSKFRGIIRISNKQLYSENFSQSIQYQ